MDLLRTPLRRLFDGAEMLLAKIFPPAWNPLGNLGALGFFFYWIITVSGIYLYIFFDTGVHNAYASVEYITHDQWYAAGVMRSFHRYASDGLIIVMLLHILREFSFDRYRGVRWFSWASGVAVMVMIYMSGITGYWLVWDKLAQYIAIVTTEWLDLLPIFGEPIARNFLSPDALESRFFTLMIFMHIAVPLIALAVLWMHLARITKPNINPPRGLAVGTFLSMLALSLVYPALSQGPADLSVVPGAVGLDWFYLPLYPLFENWPAPVTWGGGFALLFILSAIPWLPPLRKQVPAVVDLDNCNGCARCFNDCPYDAISMVGRSDDLPFEREPRVNASHCTACGICAGSCPTSMPFRRLSALSPGIDLPDFTMADLREKVERAGHALIGPGRIMVFGCGDGVALTPLERENIATIRLNCIGQLPPAFIDYVLSKGLADGVVLTGCSESTCYVRYGIRWTEDRLAGTRDPHLRARVDRTRLKKLWAGPLGAGALSQLLQDFARELADKPDLPGKGSTATSISPKDKPLNRAMEKANA